MPMLAAAADSRVLRGQPLRGNRIVGLPYEHSAILLQQGNHSP
jgi:hypothetical protein